MRKIDSDSFNRQVLEQIYEVKSALNKITPENIKYFDADVLEKARSALKIYENKDIRFASNANVNSIEMDRINKMLTYLKVRKTKISVVTSTIPLSDSRVSTSDTNFFDNDIRVDVPKYFDGRRSFFTVALGNTFVDGTDNEETYAFLPSQSNYRLQKWLDPDNSDSQKIKITIARNKTDIKIRLLSDSTYLDNINDDYFIRYFGIFWRQV